MILLTIGSKPSNRIVYNPNNNPQYKFISGYHAELMLRDDGSIYITDNGSTNGTKVNGRKIDSGMEVGVSRGDKITFADIVDLDWSKVPIIPPISPQEWDLYSVGTNFTNRIQINDSSNTVSRFHATIKVNKKTGKIYIIDSSANGTFVNGQKLAPNQETQIKWKESVLLAGNVPLDWNKIKRPIGLSSSIMMVVASVLIIAGGFLFWNMYSKPSWDYYQTSTVLIYNAYYYDVYFDDESFGKITLGAVYSDNTLDYFWPVGWDDDVQPLSSLGTGFFITEDGKIVTNKHVAEPWEFIRPGDENKIRDCISKILNNYETRVYQELISLTNATDHNDALATYRRISTMGIRKISGHSNTLRIGFYDHYYEDLDKFEPCKMLVTSDKKEIDLAILQINNKVLPESVKAVVDVSKVEQSDKILKVGDKLVTIGYPTGLAFNYRPDEGGLKPMMKSGELQRDPSKITFDINVEVLGGASGSPVFNSNKQLVGVVNSAFTNSSTFTMGILAKHITKLLEETE